MTNEEILKKYHERYKKALEEIGGAERYREAGLYTLPFVGTSLVAVAKKLRGEAIDVAEEVARILQIPVEVVREKLRELR